MNIQGGSVAAIEMWLGELRRGDAAAAERLLAHAYGRLQQMASRMMRQYPAVRRWDDTDDVWQAAAMRFHRALGQTVPESLPHFFSLAGVQIRRTLIDLARKHSGPLGLGENHDTHAGEPPTPDPTNDPVSLADWTEFHEQVGRLPDDLREVFDLLWYGGVKPAEVAEQLGVNIRTVKRRWREARLLLSELRSGYALT
jgi:RNA polymerase sigma-70 factor (ECF subfamily)